MAEKTTDILSGKLPFSILTDVPSPEERHNRVRQACSAVPALDELMSLVEHRHVLNEHGKKIKFADEDITIEQAELLFYLIAETKPILTVETGFGNGVVTGVISVAHMYNELKGGHVPIQNRPKYVLEGVGMYTLERLGIALYQIMEHETGLVLPQMYLQKLNDGLSFVYFNSATELDEQMMEYFYLNRLLQEGGIIAINTAAPARRELVDYIRKSRFDYAVREMDCGITLVQLPQPSALLQHNPRFRH